MGAPTDAILSAATVSVALAIWIDIDGIPMRYALSPVTPLHMPATTILPAADALFDNQDFIALDPRVVSVSPVSHGAGGVESVTITLSGSLELDADLLTAMSNPSMFRGRIVKMWLVRLDEAFTPTHARQFYTGYMSVPRFSLQPPDADGVAQQTIEIASENYLALIGGGAPSRTLLWSPDPDDHAADATVGAQGATAALGGWYGGVQRDVVNVWVQEK